MDFTHLYFGKASAEREVTSDPDRFLRTYLDRWDLPKQVLSHEKFLILGPKGSGKSAATFYVELEWRKKFGKEAVFANSVDFDELNRTQTPLYSLDRRLVSEEVAALTDAAWKLFIGVRLLDSLVKDNACDLAHDPQVLRLVSDLRRAGFASDDYPQVLRRVRERKGTISLSFIAGQVASNDSESLSPGQVGDALLDIVARAETPNRHLLSIDGLDKAIGENDSYWRTLAALIRVGDATCRRLQLQGNRNIYVIIMCRSDVFRHINFSDAHKISADSGIHMEWGVEAQDPLDVLLWEYISHKADTDTDSLLSLLPEYVGVGGGKRAIATPRYLLEFTRYIPRDMSQLFGSIQSRASTYRSVTSSEVRAGADHFASYDLLHEMTSEAVGLLQGEVIRHFEQALSMLPARVFDKDAFLRAMRGAGIVELISANDFGEYLFLQGAIGNYRTDSGYVQFYHRRNTAGFDHRGPWKLHTGLAYALNIPFSAGGSS